MVQELEQILKSKIRVVEDEATLKKTAQDVLTPAEVTGLNVLYTKSGNEYRIRVPRKHMKLLLKPKEKIQAALNKLTHKNFTIVFE